MTSQLRRFVPITVWLPKYEKSWLSRDVIAGVTIWGLLIPEMIAYASLAGLPPQAGLYTLLASLLLYAVFGTSRQLVVAGTSASAVLVFSTVTALHPKDAGEYATLAAGMIGLTGIIFIVAGLFRLGFITQFLSRPVMAGFVFGLALFVTIGQLPKLFGITKGDGDSIKQLAHVVTNLGSTSVVTLAVGALALLTLFGVERFLPRVPGGLVVLAGGIGFSKLFDLAAHGVETVGKIPAGLPEASVPHLTISQLWVLVPSAIGMMLVIFSEALGAGTTFADKHNYRLEPNQEMIALGFANLGTGLLGGLAGGGSLSQTAVNDGAGAKTQISPVVAAVLSLVTVIALTPLFRPLPEAVLAALIIHAVSHLMKVGEMRAFYRLVPREFWLAMLTLGSVLVLDVLPALIIGIVSSLVLLVYRVSQPHVSRLGVDPRRPETFEDVERHPDAQPIPGLLIVRPGAPIFYANAQAISDAIEAEIGAGEDPTRAVILDLDANDELDITSAQQLVRLAKALARREIPFALAHVHLPALAIARDAGLLDHIGDGNVFPNLEVAIAWAQSGPGTQA